MSYNDIEISDDKGRPVFLYSFKIGDAVFRYTSADADLTVDTYRWKAVPISDDGVKQTGDSVTDNLTITAPSNIAPVAMFNGTPPSNPMLVSIFHYHEGDTETVLSYVGEVLQVNQPQPGTATITCDVLNASMQRDGLRLSWQRNCPYALYDEVTCRVNQEDYAIDAVVTDVVDNSISLQGIGDIATGTLDGGYVEWRHQTRGIEFRAIETQVDNVVNLFGLGDGLYYGLSVKLYPGCNRTTTDCAGKFNNLDNYGGIPDLPGKSPFDGDPVF